jgi:hypothetical protein
MYLSLDILKSILMFITFSTLVHLQDQLRRRHGLMVVGFRVQFPAMLYTCVSLDILKSTLGSRLPGSIPGHAYVYNFFNAFVHLQDQLYIIYTRHASLHFGRRNWKWNGAKHVYMKAGHYFNIILIGSHRGW